MKKGTAGILGLVAGAAVSAVTVGKISRDTIDTKQGKISKFKQYYDMLNQWLLLKQEGKSLVGYFKDKGYKSIAIYGMGEMGNRLYDELKDTDIEIKYAVDQNACSIYSELKVLEKEDDLPETDAIIVTAIFAFDDIEEELSEKVNMPIVSLEDVVYES